MEIVSTSISKNKENGLEELILRKTELKQQIQDQKEIITLSSKNLLSPASISTYIFGGFSKGLKLVDGILIGYKIVRSIRRVFWK